MLVKYACSLSSDKVTNLRPLDPTKEQPCFSMLEIAIFFGVISYKTLEKKPSFKKATNFEKNPLASKK